LSSVSVRVEAEVNPTENPEKVKRANTNIISNPTFEMASKGYTAILTAKGEGKDALSLFHDLLRKEMILDSARSILLKGIDGNCIRFYLNKQVAFVNKISFCKPFVESPLGSLKVEIICDDPIEIINWLSPKTLR